MGFDAPIGMPRSYLAAVGAADFRGWLRRAPPAALVPAGPGEEWSLERPFLAIPPGEGERRRAEQRFRDRGVDWMREVEKRTGAKPVFVASGIPGAVGSSAIDLWKGLQPLDGRVPMWPFDGSLETLLRGRTPVVVAEIYPRLAYSIAIGMAGPARRSRLAVAKTRGTGRPFIASAVAPSRWVRRRRVGLEGLSRAARSDDAFDALVSAMAVLRCVLDRTPLVDRRFEDGEAEGGILLSGGVRLDLKEQVFGRSWMSMGAPSRLR
ncbi:MAG TPA: hypothetical protein VEQ10_10810 [Vicinamibacteria bacterium]|nr:hypothetical protein [Vicinamibacteria bacterium]